MFIIQNFASRGFLHVDESVEQHDDSKMRNTFVSNINHATEFDNQSIALDAAADYGQRWERSHPGVDVACLSLCRIENKGRRIAETL